MVRALTPEEMPLCIEGGHLFFKEGQLPGGFEPDVFCDRFAEMIASGTGVVFGNFAEDGEIVGALGATIAPHLFSNKLMATECFWYMLPSHRGGGLKLLRAFEWWAKSNGAEMIAMIHLHALQPEELGALYTRLGYKLIESNYLKEIS